MGVMGWAISGALMTDFLSKYEKCNITNWIESAVLKSKKTIIIDMNVNLE